jgi:hypothetical protein
LAPISEQAVPGWMVALLGVKFSIATFALPMIAVGALLKLLTRGRLALFGFVLAGFGLIFFGIEQLQFAMSGLAQQVDLSIFHYHSFGQKLFLVWIGLIMTVLLQFFSAAIMATLAAVVLDYQQDKQRLTSLLHMMVYIRVLRSDLEGVPYARAIRTQPQIYQVALDFLNILEHYVSRPDFLENSEKIENFKQELANLKQWSDEHRAALREEVMQYATLNRLSVARSLKLLAEKRWLDRLIADIKRLSKVLAER